MKWTGPILGAAGFIIALAGIAAMDRNKRLGTYIAGVGTMVIWFGMLAAFLFGIFSSSD